MISKISFLTIFLILLSGCSLLSSSDDNICSDLTQTECEQNNLCNTNFGSSICDGDVCTDDYVFLRCELKQ